MKRTIPPIRGVVLNLESCPETDVTSLDMLDQLHGELYEAGVALYLAHVADPVRDLFDRGGFLERLGPGRVFLGVDIAAAAFHETVQDPVQAPGA